MLDYRRPGDLALYFQQLDTRMWLTAKLRLDRQTADGAARVLLARHHRPKAGSLCAAWIMTDIIREAWQIFLIVRPDHKALMLRYALHGR